ncbi:MAG: hydrogenase-4 component [Gaiellaceae bacterium]|nr:hydrogenase-4 component [Gaiellaceae bacterium]
MTSREYPALALIALPALATVLLLFAPTSLVQGLARLAALPTAALALTLTVLALHASAEPVIGDWLVVDVAGGLLVGVIGVVGLASVLVSPAYLGAGTDSLVSPERRQRIYYATLYLFWAILLAVPLVGNLGAAWLLVEATTAASALLVGFSGHARALEAGWKYLVLTSLGLGVALLGIVMLAAGIPTAGLGGLSWQALSTYSSGSETALIAYLLLLAGLAAKIGWAPVHNWLPDAHSEAPPPVSALLSAALLPAVLLVAWRSQHALAPVVGEHTAQTVLIVFGLASLTVAVPFLWRSLPWKRLLAYSSLEHMGVIALGIAFGTPLALAGVAIHIVAHAVAKALGFYAATPLLSHDPLAGEHAVTGIGRSKPALGTTMGISLAALAGLPPSPLFVSEVLIVAGGFQAGHPWAASATALLLALGFLGLAHALIETTAGDSPPRRQGSIAGLRGVTALTCVSVVLLLSLVAAAVVLPGSDLVDALVRGLS